MNRIILDASGDELSKTKVIELSDHRFTHINEVLKAKKGDLLRGLVLNQGPAELEVLEMGSQSCVLKVLQVLEIKGGRGPKLVVGLCRPQTLKKLFEHGTTMGVSEFHIVMAKLSETSFLNSKVLRPDEFSSFGQGRPGPVKSLFPHASFKKTWKDKRFFGGRRSLW